MSRFAFAFGGAEILTPGVFTQHIAEPPTTPMGVATRTVAIVATSKGGAVGAGVLLKDPKQVYSNLIGGEGAEMCRIAFRHGATRVIFVRANKATSATFDFGNLLVHWKNPGTHGRSATAERAVSSKRSDAVDIKIYDTQNRRPENFVGLGPILDVQYTGAGDTPKAEIVDVLGVVTITFSAVVNGEPVDTVTISSDSVRNFRFAAELLNQSGAWIAREVGDATAPLTDLAAATVNATTIGGQSWVMLNTGVKAQFRALQRSALVIPELANNTPVNTSGFFSSGSDGGIPTVSDWVDAFDVLSQISDATHIAVGSGDEDVIGVAATHVSLMSTVKKRKERMAFVGPDLKPSKSEIFEAAKSIKNKVSSPLVTVLGVGAKDTDFISGKEKEVPAYYYAAAAAALKASNEPAFRLTNKRTTLTPQHKLDEDELEDLLENGILSVHIDEDYNYPVFTHNNTSYVIDATFCKRDISGVDMAQYLDRTLRMNYKPAIGGIGFKGSVKQIVAKARAVLEGQIRGKKNPQGILTGGNDPTTGAPVPPYGKIEAVLQNNVVVAVNTEVHFVGGTDYIFHTTYITDVEIRESA